MNKKFSTLLAAALVAGGLGSSAFAQETPTEPTYPINKYVQLTIGSKPLIVGESSVRDSLAFVRATTEEAGGPLDLYEFNQTLWQFVAEPKTGSNGLPNGYNVYLQNKVNGGVVLTKADADADKSLYYSPGAVVSTGKLLVSGATYDPETKQVTTKGTTVSFTGDVIYDAASKSLQYYYLEVNGSDVIKLRMITKELTKTDLATESALNAAKESFKDTEVAALTDAKTVSIAKVNESTAFSLNAEGLNKIDNDAFYLTFTEDVSSNAQFGNPFTASALRASTYEAYKAASYDTEAYDAALEDANDAVADLKQLKTDAASFVKELKVAIDEEGEGAGALKSKAPNASDINDITPAADMLDGEGAEAAVDAIDALVGYATSIVYADDDNDGVYLVADARAKAAELDEALKTVNDELDKIINAAEKAVNAYNEAVTNSMTSYQLKTFQWVDFKDFAAYDEDDEDNDTEADELLSAAADLLEGDDNALASLNALTTITVTPSAPSTTDLAGYYPIEVLGTPDTYVTVDTIYVADQEKYLSLNTVKLDKIAVDNVGNPLADDVKFDESKGHTYVLVPTKGHNLTPALFKVEVDPFTVGEDEITIYANAPKALDDDDIKSLGDNAPKYFNQYKDDADYYDLGIGEESSTTPGVYENQIKVVIRTLAGAREVSVMQPAEDVAVLENTTITFGEPVLASKINDGDIYFVINKNVAEEDAYDKYAVVDPIDEDHYTYAKEAFVNVPATQWLVEKNNDKYTFENRDFDAQFVLNEKIYVVDEDNLIYTTSDRDTFQLVAADAEKEGHLGYKYISEEIQKISDFALSAVNYANMETPYYLTFDGNKDSLLTATSNKEEALALIPMIVDGKQVTEAYEMNDANLSKQYYQLITKIDQDTLYLDYDLTTGEVFITQVPNDEYLLQLRSINDQPNAYEVLIGTYDETTDSYSAVRKLSYNQDGEAIAVDEKSASAFVYDLVDNSTDIYKNFGFNGSTKVIISLNGDAESKVTKIGPFATVKRTGLDETIDADYSLIMDTAYVDHKDNIRYAYYITKPIVVADTAWNAEKFYMVSYADSVAAKRDNDTIKYSQDNLTRIGFVAAKRLGTDSLAITKAVGAVATDTLNVTEELGVTNATFAFAIDENNEEAYRIEVAPTKYVSYLNGILVEGAKEQAQLFNVNATDLTPTENEEISVEDGVQVIGGKGAVTVQGAAGKTVTVYNFQGRALASTTLTSDNQTIAVPAGLVAVSVEGEPEAISVVVK